MIGSLPLLIGCGSALAAGASWRDLLNQAEQLHGEGKDEEAVKAAQGALAGAENRLGPDDPEVIRILARLSRFYEAEGDDSRFPEMEKRLSRIKSKDFEVWFALGKLARGEGKSLAAEDALKKALALKPEDPEAEYELALVYDDMGRFEDELPLLKKRIERQPQDYSLYSQLAHSYARLGRSAQAKETYAKARKIDGKTASAFIEEGYFYMNSGETVHAKQDFEGAIAVDTASPYGYHHMGAYMTLGGRQYPEGEQYFRRALDMLETDPEANAEDIRHAMNGLGIALGGQGRYQEAEYFFLKALEKARPGGVRQLHLLHYLGRLYVSQGKTAQAEETYKRAVAACAVRFKCRFDLAGRALIDLGEFHLGQGRRAEAEAAAEQAERAWKDVPVGRGLFDMLKDLSFFYASLGDVSKDEALYARLLPLRRTMPFDPDLVWVERGLAGLNAARGRFHEAEDFYRRAIGILDHDGRWSEEADVLDDLAAIDEKKDARSADEARGRAKSLRTRR